MTISSLPFGSSGRQCRPVLSCEPEPFTVASFCATWKSIVQAAAPASASSAPRRACPGLASRNFGQRCDPPARYSPACRAACAPCRPESRASSADQPSPATRVMRLQLCMPPQQISPSAASRSPNPRRRARFAERLRRSSSVALRDPVAQSARARRRIDAHDAVRPNAQVRSFLPIAHALRTWVTNFAFARRSPIAEPPPVGGHTGATTEPTTNPSRANLVAQPLQIVVGRIDADVRVEQKQIDAVELRRRSTSALAVRSSIVSRSIGGSEPGPLPTSPGHIALCKAGTCAMRLRFDLNSFAIRYI